MLKRLIQFSLEYRVLVIALAVILLLLGVRQAMELPVDVLPDLTKPTVTLLTEVPGYAAEEVEMLVTTPIEQALMGVNGVSRLRSVSDVSLSLIFAEFDWGTDIYQARQFVQEQLATAAEFLPDGMRPYMTPATSLMGDIMAVGLRDISGVMPPPDVRDYADWVVARRLKAMPGIAEVLSMGGGVKQVQVQPDPERMLRHSVTFDELLEAAAESARNTTGGFLTRHNREIMVRNLAMTSALEDLGDTVVAHRQDRSIRLGDVANLTWDTEPMRGDAGMGIAEGGQSKGSPGVVINIRKAPGYDTLDLTRKVEAALDELRRNLPENLELLVLYRQADFVELAIGNLEEALRDGAVMVAAVLFLFLMNVRVTLITLSAIPLSLALTVLVFSWFGLGVNSMTLGGLAVAIGMVVDDAIVDVENVFRRLRENAGLPAPKPRIEVIARASNEVRSSILYATTLIILVFIPLLALSGVEGRLFTPIAWATMISMAASFLVSMTVTIALCYFLLHPKPGEEHREGRLVRGLKSLYRNTALRFSLEHPVLLVCGIVALLVATTMAYRQMGGDFLPPFREPTAVIAMAAAPGTSLETTTELTRAALDQILRVPGVRLASFRAGRAERGDHVVPVSTVEFDVEFEPMDAEARSEVIDQLRAVMQQIPGTFSAFSGPLADRVGHMLSGVSAKIAVKLFGPDVDTLRMLGNQVVAIARDVPGLTEAQLEPQASIPQLRIEIDRERALAYGVTPGDLNEELAVLMGGEQVGTIYEEDRSYAIVVRLPPAWREEPDRLRNLYIHTMNGSSVPLSAVAELRMASGPNTIKRENTQRRIVVAVNPSGSDLNTAVETLQQRLATSLAMPEGYRLLIEGEYQAREEARRIILLMSLVVLAVMMLLLYGYFRSMRIMLLVLTNIPISLIGAVWYTRLTLDNISIATLVGFIAITGIAARNSIMMLSHYLHIMRHEGETFSRAAIERGSVERLVPVSMTALSAGIALIPLLLAGGEPGKEILHPVAVVIVGGLISSTLLGLCITPALFWHGCRSAAQRVVDLKAPATD